MRVRVRITVKYKWTWGPAQGTVGTKRDHTEIDDGPNLLQDLDTKVDKMTPRGTEFQSIAYQFIRL